MASSPTVEDGLWAAYSSYAALGDHTQLDSARWTKLLRDAGIHAPGFGANATDVVWSKCCPRGVRRMCFDTFIIGLGLVAEARFPGANTSDSFAAVVQAVLACRGPVLTTVSAPPPSTGEGVFGKLTNAALYTGTHRLRFDADGRGRGLAGRDAIPHGEGTHAAPVPEGDPVRDLSQLLRPGMAHGGTSLSGGSADGARRRPPALSPHDGSAASPPRRPAPPSASHFADGGGSSPHWLDGGRASSAAGARGSSSSGGGGGGGSDASSLHGGGGGGSAAAFRTPRLRVAASTTATAAGGGDLASSLGDVFQAFAQFGGTSGAGSELTSFAFAKLCREAGVVGAAAGGGGGRVPPASVDVAFAKARGPHRRTLDYDGFLFALQLLAIECYPEQAASGDPADALAVTARLAQRVVAAGGPALNLSRATAHVVAAQAMGAPGAAMPSVFSKLTDHRLFTGSSAHRFDEAGVGRGRAGREEGGDWEAAAAQPSGGSSPQGSHVGRSRGGGPAGGAWPR